MAKMFQSQGRQLRVDKPRPNTRWNQSRLGAAAAVALIACLTTDALAQTAPQPLELYRLDCGSIEVRDLGAFADTFLHEGETRTLTVSCYLVRDGDRMLLWDTGLDGALEGSERDDGDYVNRLERRIAPQLAQLGWTPDDITFVGLSHYHFDHIGQAADFPGATLLVGKDDWAVAQAWPPARARLAPWIDGGRPVESVEGDRDVFGDGRVIMLDLPGHTEGHHGLLVRLDGGAILLSGDLYHFASQVEDRGVPVFNTSRAETLASMDRFNRIASALGAKVVIQHDPADVAKLPIFPAAAR